MPRAEEIYASFLDRVQRGESTDLDQLCEEHPQLADSLRQLHSRYGMTMLPTSDMLQAVLGNTPPYNESFLDATIDDPDSVTTALEIVPSSDTSRCYRIDGEIDRGGMGVILRVWDENLKRQLAMKMIRGQQMPGDSSTPTTSAALMARFIREAEITGQLDHPGVVPVHDIGHDDDGRQYFTMRLVRGESLAAVNKQLRAGSGKWTPTRVLEVIVKVCDTLAYAHSKGVIHRDLKPANIMVGEFGETYVMDWGLAKVIGEPSTADAPAESNPVSATAGSAAVSPGGFGSGDMTLDGSVIGTPAYMPPEQAGGRIQELDARSDIYSVGTMLYELLAQVKPYGDDKTNVSQFDILKAVNAGPPTPIPLVNPKVPSEVVAICEKAMARSKADRYANISEMAEDLRAYLENRVVRAYSTGAFAEFKKWVRRNRGVAMASAVAFMFLLVGLGAVIAVQKRSNDQIAAQTKKTAAALVKEQEARVNEQEALVKEQAALVKERDARKLADEHREAAEKEREAADQQRRLAEGLLLASQSKEALNQKKPATAMLLALESFDRVPSYAANNALLAALDQHSEERMLEGHDGRVASAVYSPDGKSILTASHDGTAVIWDALSGQRKVLLLGHTKEVGSAAFSHDGQRAVTASYDGTAAIWDVRTGRRLHVFSHDQPVKAALFSPNGLLVATAGFDNQAHLWDAESGAKQRSLIGHADYIHLISFSSDGTRLLTSSADGIARVWNVASGDPIAVLEGHGQPLTTAEFSPDGQQVLTTASATGEPPDSPAQLWDAESGALLSALDTGPAAAAEFSGNGDWIAVGCGDGTVRIWDVKQQRFTQELHADGGWITQVSFRPDCRVLLAVTSNNTVITWDTESGTQLARMLGHSDSIASAEFSPDGTHLVTGSADKTARIWRTDQLTVMPQFRHPDVVHSVKLSRDRMVTLVGEQRTPYLWSISDGRLVAILPHSERVSSAFAFSPDGEVILTSAADGNAYVWSAQDGELRETLHDAGNVSAIAFAREGQTVLISSFDDKSVSKWDLKTGDLQEKIPLPGMQQHILGPDGRYFLAVEQRVDLQLLDIDSGEIVRDFELKRQFVNFRFSPDGKVMLTYNPAGTSIELWRVGTGKKLATVEVGGTIQIAEFDHQGEFLFAASRDDRFIRRFCVEPDPQPETRCSANGTIDRIIVSPDGARIVTQATDNTTTLWNLRTGERICLLASQTRIDPIRFSHNSQYLLTGDPVTPAAAESAESSVLIWDAETGERLSQIDHVGRLLGDGFTPNDDWIVSQPRGGENSIRFWSVEPAMLARRLSTRTMTADERDLYPIGTSGERYAFRRQSALAAIDATLDVLRSADTSDPELQIRIKPFLDNTLNKLSVELGPDASAAELEKMAAHIDSLLESGTVPNAPVLTWLAGVFAHRGDTVHAIEAMERAVQFPDSTADNQQKLEELREKALPDLVSYATIEAVLSQDEVSPDGRLDEFQRIANSPGERPRRQYLDARLAQNSGRIDDAIRGYRTLIEKHETHPEPYLRLAECLSARGDYASAERILRDALSYPACRTPNLWNRWAAIAFADVGLSPNELLKRISASEQAGQGLGGAHAASLKWLLQQLATGQTIRINCGGDTYTDADGNLWAADRFFTNGFRYFMGNAQFTDEIDNTMSDPLYQTERYFSAQWKSVAAGYQIPIPPGRYRVTLHFAEIYQPGVRAFDTLIEGQTVLENYDPSEMGFARADVRPFEIAVQDGLLNIEFTALREASKISAIAVESLD